MAVSAREALLGDTVYGAVDYKGCPVSRSTTGGWRSASFIIGVEMAERFVYHSIASNLIRYLTGPLQQPTAAAAANVNTWAGAAWMLPLLGAFVADSYLGRYRTILFSFLLYILGSGMLTLSATLSSLRPPDCDIKTSSTSSCPSPTRFQVVFFFMSLYVAALAVGGNKPCAQAFGADQFDPCDPKESKSKSSFFNWWYFGLCISNVVSLCIVNYIQDNLSWGLGFGVPCISMMVAMVVFLLGSKTYRYCLMEEKSPFMSILEVFVAAARNGRGPSSTTDKKSLLPIDYEPREEPLHGSSNQFKFLERAVATENLDSLKQSWSACTMSQVEDAKMVLGLVPIWATCLIYGVIIAQQSTFFTKQGSTMERGIGSGFQIPPSTLQTFIFLTVLAVVPIYDQVLVPATRAITGLSSGITVLQRIGIGMFISVVSMVVAAMVEAQRLSVARYAGLMDKPAATVPMSVWWLVPQYVLCGVAEVFVIVGLQEFFYDQVPDTMRSVGMSLFMSILGTGNFISGFLISSIEKVTERNNGEGWFSNNLNRAHLDYFYWLLAGLSAIELGIYLCFSKSYVCKSKRKNSDSM
ncbi:Proton-dependent oligopeptide transporter family [Cinnamomum micranthum f. kanehirae]|uniref:Proton-dependent oligopeptide transporter family n=1 Tax=Cinnamomum micranthum f. kanehirae TaxID=337451 RepID=A0A443NRG1_9MAGN|nr:Proton-dependent oligopeptide transporter family [Cinnamomum micranthum f. kanehirae]